MTDPGAFDLRLALKDLVPGQLETYLRAKGWTEDGRIGDKASIWHRPEAGCFDLEIVQPIDTHLRDYRQRLHEAIQTLVEFEARPAAQIIQEVARNSNPA